METCKKKEKLFIAYVTKSYSYEQGPIVKGPYFMRSFFFILILLIFIALSDHIRRMFIFLEGSRCRGSPTSTVSTCTISTSTNFSAIGTKLVLDELLCSKIRTSGNWLCSTH